MRQAVYDVLYKVVLYLLAKNANANRSLVLIGANRAHRHLLPRVLVSADGCSVRQPCPALIVSRQWLRGVPEVLSEALTCS